MNATPTTVKYEPGAILDELHAKLGDRDGRDLTLHSVPSWSIEDKKHWLPTGAVGASWLGNKPVERYDSLACDVKLSPSEYLVIGSVYERGPWLGNQVFGGVTGNQIVQRLIVVRAGKLEPADPSQDAANAQGKDKIVPLAGQTFIGSARGSRP